MSHVLSLRTVYEIARVTVPTYIESFLGRVTADKVDARMASFADRVVAQVGIDIHVVGREQVPPGVVAVFMSNHQSHMDIPVLLATLPVRTIRMVAKKELFRVPLWGRAMRAGGIVEIDRQDRARAVASLDGAAEQLRLGTSIWIAPEGSRSRTGQLGPLKKGGFHLARNAGVPIVPVALRGTRAILPPGTIDMQRGCRVTVTYGAPIPVADRTVPELVDQVESFLAEHSG